MMPQILLNDQLQLLLLSLVPGLPLVVALTLLAPSLQKMGLKLTAEEIYSINNSSLKDAIVIFGRGCTGEIIFIKISIPDQNILRCTSCW